MTDHYLELRAGDPVFREGDPGNELYVLSRGRVRVWTRDGQGRQVVLNEIGPGDFFGEMAVVRGASRSASATAVEDSTLLVYGGRDLKRLIEKHPGVAFRIIKVLAERVAVMTDELRAAGARGERP